MSAQLAILGFLRERNYHGYQLKKVIESRMGAWTDIKFGSIYHALSYLEKTGCVRIIETSSKGGKPARSIYAITNEGRQEFKRLLRENIVSMQMVYFKEDFGVFFGGHLDRAELVDILKQRIQALGELKDDLQKYSTKIEQYAPDCINLAYWLVMHHIMHIEVEMKWFRRIMQELLSGRLYPSEYTVAGIKPSLQGGG